MNDTVSVVPDIDIPVKFVNTDVKTSNVASAVMSSSVNVTDVALAATSAVSSLYGLAAVALITPLLEVIVVPSTFTIPKIASVAFLETDTNEFSMKYQIVLHGILLVNCYSIH